MSTHTNIHYMYNRATAPMLRLALLLIMIIGGMTEVWGQEEHEYYYTIYEVEKGNSSNILDTRQGDLENVWFTSFATNPSGISYSVQNSSDPQASVNIESGVLCFHQNSSSGDRSMSVSFTDSKFNVTETDWVLEFDWGASSSNANASKVSFATNEEIIFTINWAVRAATATINSANESPLTTDLPIEGYNVGVMNVPSHFTIKGNRNNGIYLTVTCNGTTYVDNVLVSSKFGYPATFNGILGRGASHMFLDNIFFNRDASITSYVVPYRKYSLSGEKLYHRGEETNKEYNKSVNDLKQREIILEYEDKSTDGKANIVYLSEAEDIEGMTRSNHSSSNSRSSNAAAAYVASGTGRVKVTTLDKGVYVLTVVFFNPGSGSAEWKFYANNEEIISYKSPTSKNISEENLPAFVIENDNTTIEIGEAGGNDKAIDLIYIQRIGEAFDVLKWIDEDGKVVTTVNVDISEIDDNNRTSAMPSRLRNDNSKKIVYASSDNNVAGLLDWYAEKNLPRIKSIGTTVISATNENSTHFENDVNLDVAKYTLNVTGATNVKGTYDKKTNTYSFNKPGQTANTATIEIEGISMTYGFNEGNGRYTTAVVVKNEEVGPILKVIDVSGFSHPNLYDGANNIPEKSASGGTYYVFKPTIDGRLTVTGQLSNATIYEESNTSVAVISGVTGKTMDVTLEKGKTYYLYNGRINSTNNATPLLHSFSYLPAYSVTFDYENKIKVDGTPSIDGFTFNNGTTLTPIIKVYNNKSGTPVEIAPSNYTVTFDSKYAGFNSGNLTTIRNEAEKKITVKATIKPTSGNVLTETLTATFNLMILSGEWDFAKYDGTRHGQLKTSNTNNGIYNNDPDVWGTTGNNRVKNRDTKNFQYILQGGENEDEPLDIAMALQSKFLVRWYNDSNRSYFHLFGAKNAGHYHGGILKVPVQKDMVIDIYAFSDSENAEMLINNDGNPYHTGMEYSAVSELKGTPVTYFYLPSENEYYSKTTEESFRYIVTNPDENGFIYIINPAQNLYLHLRKIKLSNEIVFEEGETVYVDGSKGEKVTNKILNAGSDRFTFEISDKTGTFASSSISPDSNGDIQLNGNEYGSFKVTVTGISGALNGVKANYTVHVIRMDVTKNVNVVTTDSYEWSAADLKNLVTKISYGQDAADLTELRDKVEFIEVDTDNKEKENIRNVSFIGNIGNQSLTIEGIGTVTIQARLGNVVSDNITIKISGIALSNRAPICSNTDNSIDFTINVSDENAEYDITYDKEKDEKEIFNNIIGDLRNYLNEGQADRLQITYDEKMRKFTLSRADGSPFGHGGVVPVTVKCGDTELTALITIAYSSHTWNFESNMLFYDHPKYQGIYHFYTDNNQPDEIYKRLGKWTENATIDQPKDDTTNHSPDHDWRFVRKQGIPHPGSAMIYYYNHAVDGDNAMVLPETAGLIIKSAKNSDQFGVQMTDYVPDSKSEDYVAPSSDKNNETPTAGKLVDINIDGDYVKVSGQQGYELKNVMLKLGGELVVPYVQPGQWIEMRWYRHVEDRGERMTLQNLCDVEGKPIDDTYKISNTQQGTYMFQVDPTLTKDERVDAVFHIIDNVYISIQEVRLHEPGWEYESSMRDDLVNDANSPISMQNITSEEFDILLGDHSKHNAPNGPNEWQIWMEGNLDYDAFEIDNDGNKEVEEEEDDEFGSESQRPSYYFADDKTKINVKSGWGKIYATLTSYTSDYKFVSNRKTWTITFGEPPTQKYPYTWDFTKYYKSTEDRVGGNEDDVFKSAEDITKDAADLYKDSDEAPPTFKDGYDETTNPTGSHEFRININTWNESGNEETVVTAGYMSDKYGSFFVDGAQLVGYGLKDDDSYTGRLPETAGLGFRLKNIIDGNDDNVGILQLDMQSIIDGTETEPDDGTKADPDYGTANDGATWRSGKLAIRGGGSIIVPRPILEKDGETGSQKGAENYYIYIKSSVEPDVAVNATRMIDDVNENMGMYKYRFDTDEEIANPKAADSEETDSEEADSEEADSEEAVIKENGNARFDFNGDADVYVIAVTDMLKTMTALSGTNSNEKTGWATESREMAIDHTLTGYLTKNPTKAYAVVETEDNPIYDSKSRTIVALKDQRYVAPENYGLVLKQTENVAENISINEKYKVPLFVPAVTTKVDYIDKGEYNLMRPYTTTAWPEDVNGPGEPFTSETEEVEDKDAEASGYTRFILTSRYMTWRRQDEGGKEGKVTKPTEYEEGTVAAFYRLHVFDESDVDFDENDVDFDESVVDKEVKKLNTLPLNSAYLLLKTDEINDALWNESKPSDGNLAKRLYIGIEGVSDMISGEDMDLPESPDVIDASVAQPMEIFNLRGQKLNPDSQLAPGIYIKNGKKIYIK